MRNGALKTTVCPVEIHRGAVVIKIIITITSLFSIDTKMTQGGCDIFAYASQASDTDIKQAEISILLRWRVSFRVNCHKQNLQIVRGLAVSCQLILNHG